MSPMPRIEPKYCVTNASFLAGLFDIFHITTFLTELFVFSDFLPIRTLCDAHHQEFESHQHSILDISGICASKSAISTESGPCYVHM